MQRRFSYLLRKWAALNASLSFVDRWNDTLRYSNQDGILPVGRGSRVRARNSTCLAICKTVRWFVCLSNCQTVRWLVCIFFDLNFFFCSPAVSCFTVPTGSAWSLWSCSNTACPCKITVQYLNSVFFNPMISEDFYTSFIKANIKKWFELVMDKLDIFPATLAPPPPAPMLKRDREKTR